MELAVRALAEQLDADAEGEQDSADKRVTQLAASVLLSEKYVGAFPHPQSLREFEQIVKGGAERAFQLTEREQEHRHSCDNKVIDAHIASQKAADVDRRILVVVVSLVALIGIIATVVLLALGKNIGAGVFGSISLISLLAASYFGKRSPGKGGSETEQ